MDKKNLKLKNSFTQLIGQVSNMYKEVSNQTNEAYLLGKKEALEEVLNWFMTSHNGELKYVSANSFFNMIQEKLTKTKAAMTTRGGEDVEPEIKQPINFADIKIADNRKRLNRYTFSENAQNSDPIVVEDESSGNPLYNTQLSFPFSVSSAIRSNNSNSPNSFISNQGSVINSNNINTSNQNNSPFLNTTDNNSDLISQNNFNSIGLNANQTGNIFGANLQPSLFISNKKKKK